MTSEALQVEMGKRESGRGGRGFYTPHTEKSRYRSKTRNIRG
jgi:hypothetical protein